MLVLFAILALGSWVGQLSFHGLTLGAAGVLFTALVFGHFGMTVPGEIMELGLLLFVYAVGLQAGPRFFRTFRRHGLQFVVIALAVAGVGVLVTVLVARSLRLPFQLASGLYTGAMTCTPALAAAIDVVERIAPGSSASVSVGYGIAYPYSMIGVVLLIQVLPRLLRRELRQEEADWAREKQIEEPGLVARQYRLTNPNCDEKRVSEINPHRMMLANISRVKRGERVFAATPDIVLHLGDVVMVVGPQDELDKMSLLLGEETQERMDVNTDVLSVDVEVTEDGLTGKPLSQMRVWERYNVVITRIRRQGQEIAPTGHNALEMGDHIRVVGEQAAVKAFTPLVHGTARKADETNMLPFLVGLLLGIGLGAIPLNLPNGIQVRLGSAGGAFLVSLLVGHFGGIGRLRLYVPAAAKNLSRELGLDAFPGRRRGQRRRAFCGDFAPAGRQPAARRSLDHHSVGAGGAADHAPGIPHERALHHGLVMRLHDQSTRPGGRQYPDRDRSAHPILRQRLPGSADFQDRIRPTAGRSAAERVMMSSLAQKLGIKPGFRIHLIGAPAGIVQQIREACPPEAEILASLPEARCELILFWPTRRSELEENFRQLQSRITPDGAVWAVMPKKQFARQRGIDFSWEELQAAGLQTDLVDNKVASISSEDYGTRFVIRKELRSRYD